MVFKHGEEESTEIG